MTNTPRPRPRLLELVGRHPIWSVIPAGALLALGSANLLYDLRDEDPVLPADPWGYIAVATLVLVTLVMVVCGCAVWLRDELAAARRADNARLVQESIHPPPRNGPRQRFTPERPAMTARPPADTSWLQSAGPPPTVPSAGSVYGRPVGQMPINPPRRPADDFTAIIGGFGEETQEHERREPPSGDVMAS